MSDMNASIVVKAIDRASGPLKRMTQTMENMARPARAMNRAFRFFGRDAGFGKITHAAGLVGQRLKGVGESAGRVGLKLAAAGGLAGWAFKTQLLDVASQFEQFQTVLEQTEGSSKAAKKALDWVSNFAAKTPYNLDQVMASFVQLRSYGLDPTNGLLRTLGDTAAGMGRDIKDAVEAISDAVTGENERLKGFGITTQVLGNKIVYQYSINGKQMRKIAQRGNRAMIQSTLTAIWNEKYGGQMDKMSNTWRGMMSNLEDQWMRFKLKIMKAGAFDWMKSKLSKILNTINQMADSGALQKIAADVGVRLVLALKKLWSAGKAIVQVGGVLFGVASSVAAALGGWEHLGYLIAALFGLKLAASVWMAAVAFKGLGIAIMTTPVGWIMAGIAFIAGGAYLIYKNWTPIANFFKGLWRDISAAFKQGFIWGILNVLKTFNPTIWIAKGVNALIKYLFGVDMFGAATKWMGGFVDGVVARWRALTAWLSGAIAKLTGMMPDWVKNKMGLATTTTTRPSAPAVRTRNRHDKNFSATVGGEIHLKIDSEGRPHVKVLKSDNPNVGINVDTGLVMGAAG